MDSKKIAIIIIAIIIIAIAVFLVVNPFNISVTSSSSSTSSESSMVFSNGVLNIDGKEFKIPGGFDQLDNESEVGVDAPSVAQGAKSTYGTFSNGTDEIVVKVFTGPSDFTELNVEGESKNVTYGSFNGLLHQDEGLFLFDCIVDGKLIEIVAPSEDIISSILS